MIRRMLLPSMAATSWLLLSLPVYSQVSSDRRQVRARMAAAELDVQMHELELKKAELAVDDASVEVEKIKLHVAAAKAQGDSNEVGHAELELKQTAIHLEMRKLQLAMTRLQIERAKVELAFVRAVLPEKPGKPTRVQFEYAEDSDVVVIRGPKESVDKIKALIADAKKNQKADD